VLQDSDLSFFKAMLVPAAHVYFHVVEGKGEHKLTSLFLLVPLVPGVSILT